MVKSLHGSGKFVPPSTLSSHETDRLISGPPAADTDSLGSSLVHFASSFEVGIESGGTAFNPEVFIGATTELMQIRSDSFDILRTGADTGVVEIFEKASGNAGVYNPDLGKISRAHQRQVERRINPRADALFLAIIAEARLEARGMADSGSGKSFDYSKLIGHFDARGTNTANLKASMQKAYNNPDSDNPKTEDQLAAERLDIAEDELWQIIEQTTGNLRGMKGFVDWLESMDSAQKQEVSPLLELLAVDLSDDQSPARFKHILDSVYDTSVREITHDFMAQVFSGENAQSKEVLRWTELLTDDQDTAMQLMLDRVELWPESLKTALGVYVHNEKTLRLAGLLDYLKPHFFKYQQVPTYDRGMDTFNIRIMQGRGVSGVVNNGKKRKSVKSGRPSSTNGRATPKSTVSSIEHNKVPENKVLTIDVNGHGMNVDSEEWTQYTDREQDLEIMDNVIQRYAAQYPHEKNLVDDITRMIDSIRLRPFGDGTTPLTRLYLSDGTRVRRLNPVHQSGLSTSTEIAKDTRILYAAKRSDLGNTISGIITILRHDEYERWIAGRS